MYGDCCHPARFAGEQTLKTSEAQGCRAQLISALPSVPEVPRSIPGDITSLLQLLSFLCNFTFTFKYPRAEHLWREGGGGGRG